MNKIFLVLFFSILSIFTYSKTRIQGSFFSVNNDTITFYFNEEGNITTKSKAYIYRKAKFDTTIYSYSGNLCDYYMNNQKAYECNYINRKLNGGVQCFYPNGKLKYSGYYKKSVKDSIWTFYYNNGNIEKIIYFDKNTPYIKEFYKRNGDLVFNNGNGKFKSIIRYGNELLECTISGKIVNGKMEGPWHWNGDHAGGIEYFKNGEYTKTETFGLRDGFTEPRIISITGYDPHENIAIFDFMGITQESIWSDAKLYGIPVTFKSKDIATKVSVNSSSTNNLPLAYKDSPNLRAGFSNDLANYLIEAKDKKHITDFWCFIQFSVNEKGRVENINTYCNKKEINPIVYEFLSKINDFKAAVINNETVKCDVYLNVFFMNNTLYIPDYRYNNSMLNLFNL